MPVPRFLTLCWRFCLLLCAGSALEMRWEKLLSSFPKTDHQDIAGSWGAGWHSFIVSRCSACFEFLLLSFSNRRELGSIDEVPQISLEDALSSQEVEVAFICSESSSHEDYIRWVFKSSPCTVVQDSENTWADILHRDLNNQWDGSRTLKNCHQNVNLKNCHQNVNSHYGL